MTEATLRSADVRPQGEAENAPQTMIMVVQSKTQTADGCAKIELDISKMRRGAKVREEKDATVITSFVVNEDQESACIQQTSDEMLKLFATVVKQQAETDYNQYSTDEQEGILARMRRENDLLDSIFRLRQEQQAVLTRAIAARHAAEASAQNTVVAAPRSFANNVICLGGFRAEKSSH